MDLLTNLEVATVKSFLAAKLFEAQNQGVEVRVEIPEVIHDIPIKILDFIIISSIFCDNAIESALETNEKKVNLALF